MSARNTLCLVAAFSLFAGSLIAADDDPFVGTWKLNVEKSTYKGIPKPKEETVVVTHQGDNQVLSFSGTGADGSPIKVEITVPVQGGPMRITGTRLNQSWDTATLKRINPTTEEMTYSKDGKQVGARHVKITGNQRTLTARYTGPGPQGKTVTQNDVWEKQ